MDKVIIFGCGPTGLRTYHLLKDRKEIVAFFDNDEKKAGSHIEGISVYLPDEKLLKAMDFDYIIIASVYGDKQIREQLHAMGINNDRMAAYPKTPNVLLSFLYNLAEDFVSENVEGACAEVGVFRGVNARIINHFFENRKLHLFDTFEGFSENDIEPEREIGRRDAKKGQYSDTSIEVVMKNMEHPEQVILHKGYFPDTAKELNEPFCFVRIDLDLYAPTKAALEIFVPLMVPGGVILVHDYFGSQYPGINKVVKEFMTEHPRLSKIPIGDAMSIAIIGF